MPALEVRQLRVVDLAPDDEERAALPADRVAVDVDVLTGVELVDRLEPGARLLGRRDVEEPQRTDRRGGLVDRRLRHAAFAVVGLDGGGLIDPGRPAGRLQRRLDVFPLHLELRAAQDDRVVQGSADRPEQRHHERASERDRRPEQHRRPPTSHELVVLEAPGPHRGGDGRDEQQEPPRSRHDREGERDRGPDQGDPEDRPRQGNPGCAGADRGHGQRDEGERHHGHEPGRHGAGGDVDAADGRARAAEDVAVAAPRERVSRQPDLHGQREQQQAAEREPECGGSARDPRRGTASEALALHHRQPHADRDDRDGREGEPDRREPGEAHQRGLGEDVEPDVETEDRVGDAEVAPVAPGEQLVAR